MKQRISDLLDVLPEVDVDIGCTAAGSEERILELTRKRITPPPQKRRGSSWVGRVLIAAAILAAVAIPAVASDDFSFEYLEKVITALRGGGQEAANDPVYESESSWETTPDLDTMLNVLPLGEYNRDVHLGAGSKNWSAGGWAVELSAQEPTAEQIIFQCIVMSVPEEPGNCSFSNGWCLEMWTGTGYKETDIQSTDESVMVLQPGDQLRLPIRFEEPLECGFYRIRKQFFWNDGNGAEKSYRFYAKFRVLPSNMQESIVKIRDGITRLNTQPALHLSITSYNDQPGSWHYRCEELWRAGEDYLEISKCINADGSLFRHSGLLYRDGKHYSLTWSTGNKEDPLAFWSVVGLTHAEAEDWLIGLECFDSMIGYIRGNDSQLSVLEYHTWRGEGYYRKLDYTFDDAGNVLGLAYSTLPNPDAQAEPEQTVVIHDTPVEDIQGILDFYVLETPSTFSWDQEKAAYPAGAEGVQTDGFVNTAYDPVDYSDDNALAQARQELGITRQRSFYLYRDKANKMWKVVLHIGKGTTTVYLGEDGITRLIVKELSVPEI